MQDVRLNHIYNGLKFRLGRSVEISERRVLSEQPLTAALTELGKLLDEENCGARVRSKCDYGNSF